MKERKRKGESIQGVAENSAYSHAHSRFPSSEGDALQKYNSLYTDRLYIQIVLRVDHQPLQHSNMVIKHPDT